MPRILTPCPLCTVPYMAVRQHPLKLRCPFCRHMDSARLDKHLDSDIDKTRRRSIIKTAKQHLRLRGLRRLRKTNPQPPMVRTLDIDKLSSSSEDEDGEEGTGVENSPGFAGRSRSPSPSPSTSSASSHAHPSQTCHHCLDLKMKIRRLKGKLYAAESRTSLPYHPDPAPIQRSTPPIQRSTPPIQRSTPPIQRSTPRSQPSTHQGQQQQPQREWSTPQKPQPTSHSQHSTPPKQRSAPPSQSSTPQKQQSTPQKPPPSPQSQCSTPQQQQSAPQTSDTPSRHKFERRVTVISKQQTSTASFPKTHRHAARELSRWSLGQRMTRVAHARRWLLFMVDRTIPDMSFSFLKNRDRLFEWTETLKENAPTTQLIIIGSVPAFLKFLLEAQHPDVTAPSKRLQTALWTLKTMAMMCRKGLERHRQAVRTKTSGGGPWLT